MVCHLRISEQSLSRVSVRPWKSVKQFLPCTSSMQSLTFLYDWSSSLFKSAKFNSRTRPFSCSEAILVPWVLVTSVFPHWRVLNTLGALMSYHSFFRKGSPAFFLPPFLPPLVSRLFLPTAIAPQRWEQAKTPSNLPRAPP